MAVHPNIKVVHNNAHFKHCWNYHAKDPINRWESALKPLFDDACFDAIKKASSLGEACVLAGIEVKSVTDLVHIRADRKKVDMRIPPIVNQGTWTFEHYPWDKDCVIFSGVSGAGKTRFAISHCEDPDLVCIARCAEDLKRVDAETELIIFDDFDFGQYSIEQCIHFVDTEVPTSLNVKYGSVNLPAGMRRIITTNKSFDELFPLDSHGAVRRRVDIIHFPSKCWTRAPAPPVAEVEEEPDDGELALDLLLGDDYFQHSQDGGSV